MNTRHVSIRSHGLKTDPHVTVYGMPIWRSLYNLSQDKDGLLYLVEVDEHAIHNPDSFGLFIGRKDLEYVPILERQIGKESMLRFRNKDREGKLWFKEFGIGSVQLAYLRKDERVQLGDIERLANIQHYTPRNSHMPEVRYIDSRRFFNIADEVR